MIIDKQKRVDLLIAQQVQLKVSLTADVSSEMQYVPVEEQVGALHRYDPYDGVKPVMPLPLISMYIMSVKSDPRRTCNCSM